MGDKNTQDNMSSSAKIQSGCGSLEQEVLFWKKAAQEAQGLLVQSQARCKAFFDTSADGILECNLEGVFTNVNPVFCTMLGYDQEWLIGRNYRDITHPDCLGAEQEAVQKAIKARMDYARYEKSYVKNGGEELPISITVWVVRNDHNKPTGHIAVVRDISSIRQREQSLVESMERVEQQVQQRTRDLVEANEKLHVEIMRRQATHEAWETSDARYQALVESIKEMVFFTDPLGKVTYSNQAVQEVLGYSPEQVLGNSLFDFLIDQDRDRAMDQFTKAFVQAPQEGEFQAVAKAGHPVWLQVTGRPWNATTGTGGMRFVALDISQSRKLQRERLQSERLAGAGELAVFLAQEIANHIQKLDNLPQALENMAGEDPLIAPSAGLLSNTLGSIHDAVSRLLGLNLWTDEPHKAVNVNQCITDALYLLEGRIRRYGIRTNLNLSSRVPYTMACQGRLDHLFFTLLLHACGAIASTWEAGQSVPGEINVTTRRKKDKIIIELSDNGVGLSRHDCHHIFDPEYPGTGQAAIWVGLQSSRIIVQDHGGSIRVAPSPEGGAHFTLELPVRRPGA